MKAFILLFSLAYLHIASCKSLPRHIDDDFNKSLNQLSNIIENGVNLGDNSLRGISAAVKYISEVDTEITVRNIETVEYSTLKKIEELGNDLCYEYAKADLAEAWYYSLLDIKDGFNETMENMEVVYLDGILRLIQYQDVIVGFEERYRECKSDDCKQNVYDDVLVEIDTIDDKIKADAQDSKMKIEQFIITYEEGTLMPVLDAFTEKSDAILLKAKECASNAEMDY